MSEQIRGIAWGQITVTAIFSLIVGVLLFQYTNKSPELVYESFPPAHFTKNSIQISIYNLSLENIGGKEAEDVQIYLELPDSSNIQDLKVDPSLNSIKYTVSGERNSKEIFFPRLNQGESSRFSILADKGLSEQLKVEVRGKGVIGHPDRKETSTVSFWMGILGLAFALIVLIFSLIGRYYSEKELGNLFNSQKRLLDRELQFVRTKDGAGQESIEKVILSTPYRFFFKPDVPGLSKSKIMRFAKGGVITEGQNKNENSWRVIGDFLELINSQNQVHNRFYYGVSNRRFYSTNDPDCGAIIKHGIRDQYMIPESK